MAQINVSIYLLKYLLYHMPNHTAQPAAFRQCYHRRRAVPSKQNSASALCETRRAISKGNATRSVPAAERGPRRAGGRLQRARDLQSRLSIAEVQPSDEIHGGTKPTRQPPGPAPPPFAQWRLLSKLRSARVRSRSAGARWEMRPAAAYRDSAAWRSNCQPT